MVNELVVGGYLVHHKCDEVTVPDELAISSYCVSLARYQTGHQYNMISIILSVYNKYFELKNSWGAGAPLNSNYLLLLLYCSHPYYMKP